MRCMDGIRLQHQIVVDEFRRQGIVREDAAHLSGSENHRGRLILLQPNLDGLLIAKIYDRPVDGENSPALAAKEAGDRTSHHAVMTGNPDTLFTHLNLRRSSRGSYAADTSMRSASGAASVQPARG